MKILRRGRKMQCQCKYCGSLFEYKDKDSYRININKRMCTSYRVIEENEVIYECVTCPVCGFTIKLATINEIKDNKE